MSDNNKKRTNSFRKIFPNLFFSHKSKEKSLSKKSAPENNFSSKANTYQNPRCIISKPEKYLANVDDNDDRIYENLSNTNRSQVDKDMETNDIHSNHSSSSTLVSENIKKYAMPIKTMDIEEKASYSARPQVPPKPNNEVVQSMFIQNNSGTHCQSSMYPDVYYHSMEKLTNKISPIDEIEIYKASQAQVHPTSVGAEIKKVSTKILISPKKEAEVRTIQPIRARSLSFEKDKPENTIIYAKSDKKNDLSKKPYNYSAPTSPIAVSHKIPNMPTTVSPYEHVRKTIFEIEEKRNSLSRSSVHNKSTPSPTPQYMDPQRLSSPVASKHTNHDDSIDKEKTRQKVEAFYWQKIKEQKDREDEYFLRQSLNSSLRSSSKYNTSYSNSNRSTPSSLAVEAKSCSLPRGRDLNFMINQPMYAAGPFVRGSQERRTDSYIVNRTSNPDQNIMYRNPEKFILKSSPLINRHQNMPIIQRGPLTQDIRHMNQQMKRVSFEEHLQKSMSVSTELKSLSDYNQSNNSDVSGLKLCDGTQKDPPVPPVRTTSVSSAGKSYRIADNKRIMHLAAGGYSLCSESESGSEAGEIQKILQNNANKEEDWQDGTRGDGGLSDGETGRGSGFSRSRGSRREDPRRHTLGGNQHLYISPHHQPTGQHDMEPSFQRGYPPPNNALLFDDDPGVMSEVETASTGFRRGGKQRSSLPVVRTPSKTLERPLGLVFLQYRNETKRALLPNEITSIDTVKALFVRSFSQQLTMAYMDSPRVKIYIHDSSKDMFYELEDARTHLRDIRDRSVLRVLEAGDMGGGPLPGVVAVGAVAMPPGAEPCPGPSNWDQDQSYFSEPEIDSEYHHQHVHKTKGKAPAYYMGAPAPSTLPRGGSVLRAYSPATPPVPADRVKTIPAPVHGAEGYMSSPERAAPRGPYEDPYYTQFLGPSTSRAAINPVIDEEATDGVLVDDAYGVYPITTAPRPMGRPPYDARLGQVEDIQRLRVEKMERQLANLTGLVQQALQVPPGPVAPAVAPRNDLPPYATRTVPQDAVRYASYERPPKLGKDRFQKSVSFEKSVSFSDDPPDMNSPKQHSPQHSADTKPTKPAIKSSTLPRTSSQERDRLKPAPPPKPAGLGAQPNVLAPQRTYQLNVTPDFFNHLQNLLKQSRDLRIETRNLRRSTLSHAMQMRTLMADTIVKIGALAASFSEDNPESLTREEEIYRQEMLLLENDLYELEATVERLRGQAANRETRVNMADIERIAMVLSKSSKTVADWKLKFPILHDTMKAKLTSEMEKMVRKEKMLEEEPERLELALRRCKKLTGTLVTLKRLACVQEQRLPHNDGRMSPESSQSSFTAGPSSEECNPDTVCPMATSHNKTSTAGRNGTPRGGGSGGGGGGGGGGGPAELRPENALDALLDELQTFAKPTGGRGDGQLRRLHSYPSGSDTDASPPVRARGQHPPKPPVPERHPELLALAARRAPPPPPPRTTSRSPLASPTSPASPPRDPDDENAAARQALLEQRHQELLKKQKALQEQYARLQMIQRSGSALPPNAQPDLKKTGSESNLLSKMNLNLAPANMSGSMTHLAGDIDRKKNAEISASEKTGCQVSMANDVVATTNKVYETDIL